MKHLSSGLWFAACVFQRVSFSRREGGFFLIHQYKNNGYNIVLDVHSGSVHVVDDLVYDVIACWMKGLDEKEIHMKGADGQYPGREIEGSIWKMCECS